MSSKYTHINSIICYKVFEIFVYEDTINKIYNKVLIIIESKKKVNNFNKQKWGYMD